jgi:hypothetical protein
MMDLLMIGLLAVAFAGSLGYVRSCSRLVDAENAIEDRPR